MASAWGSSWSSAWGSSWGALATVATAPAASGGFPYWPDHRRRRVEDEEPAPEVIAQAVEVAARKVVARVLAPRPPPDLAALERRELAAALERVDVARTEMIDAKMRLEVSRVLAHHKRLMAEDEEFLLL